MCELDKRKWNEMLYECQSSCLWWFVKFDSLMEVLFCQTTLALGFSFIIIGQWVLFVAKSVLFFLWMYIGSEVMGMTTILSTSMIQSNFMSSYYFSSYPIVAGIVMIISSICVVYRPQQILTDSYAWIRGKTQSSSIYSWPYLGWLFNVGLRDVELLIPRSS